MRHIVGSIGILVAVGFLGGCSPAQRTSAHAPSDVFGVMDKEIAQSLLGKNDAFGAMDAELAHAIGTTSLSSATMLAPMPLPDERMSMAAFAAENAPRTWGAAEPPLPNASVTLPTTTAMLSEIDPSDIPSTRE